MTTNKATQVLAGLAAILALAGCRNITAPPTLAQGEAPCWYGSRGALVELFYYRSPSVPRLLSVSFDSRNGSATIRAHFDGTPPTQSNAVDAATPLALALFDVRNPVSYTPPEAHITAAGFAGDTVGIFDGVNWRHLGTGSFTVHGGSLTVTFPEALLPFDPLSIEVTELEPVNQWPDNGSGAWMDTTLTTHPEWAAK